MADYSGVHRSKKTDHGVSSPKPAPSKAVLILRRILISILMIALWVLILVLRHHCADRADPSQDAHSDSASDHYPTLVLPDFELPEITIPEIPDDLQAQFDALIASGSDLGGD